MQGAIIDLWNSHPQDGGDGDLKMAVKKGFPRFIEDRPIQP